jgi:hypothetical protein
MKLCRGGEPDARKRLYFCRGGMGARAMGKWMTMLLLAGMALPAMAAKSLSVEQLEQLLAANQGKADAHVAQQLAEVELMERVSPERLAKWEKNFPGPKTRETLPGGRGGISQDCYSRSGSDSGAGQRYAGEDACPGERVREDDDHAAAEFLCHARDDAL